MITRKVSGSHICLRVRYSLFKRSAAIDQHRHASQKSKRYEYLPSTKDELERDNYRSRSDRRSQLAGVGTDAQSFGGLYGHHGQARRAAIEDLNTKSLNTPAKAIVLRDTIFNYYTYDRDIIKPQLAEHIDIEEQLNEERGLVSQKEINENINSFKPKLGHEPSSWDDINNLVRELQSGFTISQLQKYMELYKEQTPVDLEDVEWEESIKDSSLVHITPWMPGISDIEHTFDIDPLRGYFLDSHTRKQRSILRLLRNCWHVELPELAEGIGQFEIEISSNDLEILLLGPPSALDEICGQGLILEQEKMEVFRSRNVVRVTTLQHKRRWITDQVKEAVSNISRTTIDLRDITPLPNTAPANQGVLISQNFSSPMLDELSRLTNCHISRIDGTHIQVTYLKDIEDETGSSASTIESVRRLLISSVRSARVETQLAQSMLNNRNTKFIRCPPQLSSSLPWYDRYRDWSRWTAPIGVHSSEQKVVPIARLSSPMFGTKVSQDSFDDLSVVRKVVTGSKDPVWNSQYTTQTSALLGTILHEDMAPKSEHSWDPRSCQSSFEKEHTFSTNLPCVSSILNRKDITLLNAGQPSVELVLRFLPNPFSVMPSNISQESKRYHPTGSQALSALPPIEMRFVYHASNEFTALKDVSAIVHNTRTDVMLPDNLIDTRFEQLTISRLRGHLENDQPPRNVLEYIDASKLSFADGIIEPAATIKFPITKHIAQESKLEPLDFEDDNYRMEYLFAGLEIRTKLEHSWQGWLLDYTSIKAGRAAGSRSELRLHPIKDGVPVGEEEFVEAAYKLADLIGGGDGGSKLRRTYTGSKDVLVRKIGSLKGTQRPAFECFVKRIDISPVEEAGFSAGDEAGAETEGLRSEAACLISMEDGFTSESSVSSQSGELEQEATKQSEDSRRNSTSLDVEEDHPASETSTSAKSQDFEQEVISQSEDSRKKPVSLGLEKDDVASESSEGALPQNLEHGTTTKSDDVVKSEEENKSS